MQFGLRQFGQFQIIFIFRLQPMLTQVTSLWAIYQVSHCSPGATAGFIQLLYPHSVELPKTLKQPWHWPGLSFSSVTLKWRQTFPPLAFPSGVMVGVAVAKITFCYLERSFLFISELQIKNDTGQNTSSFNHVVYNRNRWPVNLLSPRWPRACWQTNFLPRCLTVSRKL